MPVRDPIAWGPGSSYAVPCGAAAGYLGKSFFFNFPALVGWGLNAREWMGWMGDYKGGYRCFVKELWMQGFGGEYCVADMGKWVLSGA